VSSNARISLLRRLASAVALGAGVFVGVDGFVVEPYALEMTPHAITARVDSPLTLVHLSDLHTSGFGRREQRLVELVSEARPDVIVITGDVVDGGDLEPAREVLRGLHAPLGVFAVRGNWENWKRPPNEGAFYSSVGITLLVNEGRLVRRDVWIAGLDDPMSGFAHLDAAQEGAPDGALRVVLFHSPELFDTIAPKLDLAFAGHTHGGQVRVPFLGSLWMPPGSGRFVDGWYGAGAARMLVSRGAGTSILPVRLFCPPEIARITITPGNEAGHSPWAPRSPHG
jgi:predicted MPP superfamily phosphohydrolase